MTDKLMGNFIWKFENSTLPTNIVIDGFQYPIIRTTYKKGFRATFCFSQKNQKNIFYYIFTTESKL